MKWLARMAAYQIKQKFQALTDQVLQRKHPPNPKAPRQRRVVVNVKYK
jgi:hypothetical protein